MHQLVYTKLTEVYCILFWYCEYPQMRGRKLKLNADISEYMHLIVIIHDKVLL